MKIRAALSLCLALSLALIAPLAARAQSENRSLLFQVGAGMGFPSYPPAVEEAFSYLDSQLGIDRVQVSVDVGLGISLSPKTFLMARMDGLGDRLFDAYEYYQMNLYVYSLGLRYYPSTTGFYVDGGLGSAASVEMTSSGDFIPSEFGFGFGAGIGYDFCPTPRGFGFTVEARYDGLSIANDEASGIMVTANLAWK